MQKEAHVDSGGQQPHVEQIKRKMQSQVNNLQMSVP